MLEYCAGISKTLQPERTILFRDFVEDYRIPVHGNTFTARFANGSNTVINVSGALLTVVKMFMVQMPEILEA